MNKKLGFGLMRLPYVDKSKDNTIDIPLVKKMVDYFMENGFTYFDTALMYCNGKSESVVKEALTSRYPRDSYTLATKLHFDYFNSTEERDKVFDEQLERCGVDYFDYYLIHDVEKPYYDTYNKFDCWNWLVEKKAAGQIKEIGFSFHDGAKFLDKVLTEHPEVDFVQLQLNYLDWENEGIQSRACYEVARKHNKKIIVMEPVKGGMLADVPTAVREMFLNYDSTKSIPSWAIRFVASLPNVFMVLSGMSNMEQMIDNVSYMKDFEPLTEDEIKMVHSATDIISSNIEIPCTGCYYCLVCPKEIVIADIFNMYNLDKQETDENIKKPQQAYYDRYTSDGGDASSCIKCGKCEELCPQHLPIREHLQTLAEYFGH